MQQSMQQSQPPKYVSVQKVVVVRFERIGFHCWPTAPEPRAYLRDRHRHTFKFEVCVPVVDSDREIEFHDLIDWCKAQIPDVSEFGSWSCEHIAEWLGQELLLHFGLESCAVGVFEEDEAGDLVEVRVADTNEG